MANKIVMGIDLPDEGLPLGTVHEEISPPLLQMMRTRYSEVWVQGRYSKVKLRDGEFHYLSFDR